MRHAQAVRSGGRLQVITTPLSIIHECSSTFINQAGHWAPRKGNYTLEYSGSKACSASMRAAVPPLFCTSAMACSASVVLPLLSGPYT